MDREEHEPAIMRKNGKKKKKTTGTDPHDENAYVSAALKCMNAYLPF